MNSEESLDFLISSRHSYEAGTPQHYICECVTALFEGTNVDTPCDIDSDEQSKKFGEEDSIKDQKIADKTKNKDSMWLV